MIAQLKALAPVAAGSNSDVTFLEENPAPDVSGSFPIFRSYSRWRGDDVVGTPECLDFQLSTPKPLPWTESYTGSKSIYIIPTACQLS